MIILFCLYIILLSDTCHALVVYSNSRFALLFFDKIVHDIPLKSLAKIEDPNPDVDRLLEPSMRLKNPVSIIIRLIFVPISSLSASLGKSMPILMLNEWIPDIPSLKKLRWQVQEHQAVS